MILSKIDYAQLNSRQKENFNFQKVSAVLADYGYATIRLSDDWQGADFIAQHIDGLAFLKVQLKGRLCFYKKYEGKSIWIAFSQADAWYLYPHDDVLAQALALTSIGPTVSWAERGGYSFPNIPKSMVEVLAPYRITGDTRAIPEDA